jgi:DNA-binding transcriptional LysR family regulator
MNIKQVKAFLAVAQSMSFASAATQLHLSQPALSARSYRKAIIGAMGKC